MNYEVGRSTATATLEWLRANESVRQAARADIEHAGKALPDAVLDDPSRLVELVKATLVEAIRTDAPVGVVEELLPVLRVLTIGATGFDRNSVVAKELSAMQGMRDSSEIAAALALRAADAPDELTRATIDRMRLLAERQPASDELFTLAPDESSPAPTFPGGEVGPGGIDPGSGGETGVGPVEGTTGETGTGSLTGGGDGSASSAGAELGAIIGAYLGGPSGAEQGAQIGGQLGGGGGLTPAELGAQIGQQLGGPQGAQIGAQLGAQIGGSQDIVQKLHGLVDAAACALCGSVFCLPCVLAAESLVDVVVHLVHQILR